MATIDIVEKKTHVGLETERALDWEAQQGRTREIRILTRRLQDAMREVQAKRVTGDPHALDFVRTLYESLTLLSAIDSTLRSSGF
jgi:hypothetical protein